MHEGASPQSSITSVLGSEFARIAATTGTRFDTVEAMAGQLGINKTYLSKLRSGTQPLTKKMARKLAAKLREGDAHAITQLENELLKATESGPRVMLDIHNWFNEREAPGNLMVVEFREKPVVRPGEGKSYALDIVGEALASGFQYAMVYPYVRRDPERSTPLSSYIDAIWEDVSKTYSAILRRAFDHVLDNPSIASLPRAKLEQHLHSISARLRLYYLERDAQLATAKKGDTVERVKFLSSSCPGIGYRLFYTDYKDPKVPSDEPEPREGQLWQWISWPSPYDKDDMVPRESTPEIIKATTIRFFPIVEFWRMRNKLPQSAEALRSFAQELEIRESYASRHGLDVNAFRWAVEGEGKEAAFIKQYLKEKNLAHQ